MALNRKTMVVLIFAIITYIGTSSLEILLIKWLNYSVKIDLPVFCAFMVNGYFPLQGIMYLILRRIKEPNHRLTGGNILGYTIIGFFAAIVTTARAFGINAIPGSVYVIIASADVLFQTLLSRIFLKKTFTLYHYLAVFIIMGAVAIIASAKEKDSHYDCDGDTCVDDWIPGIIMCLVSALVSAINNVLAEKLLTGQPTNKLLSVSETSFFNSLIPCVFLPYVLVMNEEHRRWGPDISKADDEGKLWIVILCAIGLACGKMGDRMCKFGIVSLKGAFFFGLIDSIRRLLNAVLAIYIFGETESWQKYVGLALTVVAVIIYSYGSLIKKKAEQKRAAEALLAKGDGSDAEEEDATAEVVQTLTRAVSSLAVTIMGGESAATKGLSRRHTMGGSIQTSNRTPGNTMKPEDIIAARGVHGTAQKHFMRSLRPGDVNQSQDGMKMYVLQPGGQTIWLPEAANGYTIHEQDRRTPQEQAVPVVVQEHVADRSPEVLHVADRSA